jgi:transcriptional regulator with XRE-family HTH domain
MSFYERFESLCKERGLRPQSDEIIEITGVSSPAITGWKKGSAPKADVLIRIATYFGVSVDYLLGMESKNDILMERADLILKASDADITEQEKTLLAMFRSTSEEGRLRIIQAVMNIHDEIEKKPTTSSESVVG